MIKNNKVVEEIINTDCNIKEERLQITIEEYNYNNYINYINRKEQKEVEESPRVIIIDLWYNINKKGKKWVLAYKT